MMEFSPSAPGRPEARFHVGRMCHWTRETDYSCDMRSRFWLGNEGDHAIGGAPARRLVRAAAVYRGDPGLI
jgi:hypothetical protein